MTRPTETVAALFLAVILSGLGTTQASVAQGSQNKACGLVTAAELQSVLGSAVTLQPIAGGNVAMCGGEAQNARVLLRTFTRTGDPSGKTEQAGIEAARKMGAQVEAKTSGGIMCMTAVPPPSMAAAGYNTTCTVMSKAPKFAVIEVTTTAQKDMVPMERLRAVAEKMAGRL